MTPDDPRIPPERPDLDAASGRATPAPGSRGAGRAAEPDGTEPASGVGPHTDDRPPLDADLDEQASAALDDATEG
ncbi:MAG TPA: hypothetical protein VJM49_22295, partial [Acidimicrobiales bacterium]|nr:hypothetical protein [Acidimicrobiales bacterium]